MTENSKGIAVDLIEIDNLAKKYCRRLRTALWYGVQDIAREVTGTQHGGDGQLRKHEFWALQGIDLRLRRGECLGVIGPNGAGKTTLLKLLNGLLKPNGGKITVRGRVGALIELGAGFNPILTGRENVYINGAVLGLSTKEIDRIFPSVVEFSELSEFIDSPVQSYSSGMKVRLGFAVASHLTPDVLLIDEILAVGDVGFQAKCLNAIDRISRHAAVIYVSHALAQVSRICSRILVLDQGRAVYSGSDVARGIEQYYEQFHPEKSRTGGNAKATVHDVRLHVGSSSEANASSSKIGYLDDLSIEIACSLDSSVRAASVTLVFYTPELRQVAESSSHHCGYILANDRDILRFRARFHKLQLNPGAYLMSLAIREYADNGARGEILYYQQTAKQFYVTGKLLGGSPIHLHGEWGNMNSSLGTPGSSLAHS